MKIDIKLDKKIFNDVYFPYLMDYNRRYEVYYGSAGSGKSAFVFQKILVKALKEKRKILIVRKTAKSNENSTFQLLKDTISRFHLFDYCTINKTTQKIELVNGSIFLFAGLDDVEKLKSIAGITDIVIEEATEITEDDFTQLDLRLRAKQRHLQIFLMFNPISKANWVYKRWFAENAVIGTDTFILHTTYKDNKFLPEEYVAAIESMKETNPTYYRIYALGEFASLDKLVYNNWEVREFDVNEPPYRNLELLCGLDFGFVNDTTAFICSLLDEENKVLYIFKEWCSKGKTNDEIASSISSLGFSKSIIIADSAEQKSIEEIRRLGIRKIKPCVKGKGSILQGIQKLQQYNIVVHPDCETTINELQNYSWKKDKTTGEYVNIPIDDFNHCMDALRYSLQCIKGSIKTINKSKLF